MTQPVSVRFAPPVPKAVLLQHGLTLLPAAGIVKFDILQGVNIRHDIPLPPRLVNGDEVVAHIVEDSLPGNRSLRPHQKRSHYIVSLISGQHGLDGAVVGLLHAEGVLDHVLWQICSDPRHIAHGHHLSTGQGDVLRSLR